MSRTPAFDAAPPLESARLRFRAHRLADFDASAALWADPIVVRHISGRASTRAESWSRLVRYVGHWRLLGFGYWAVEEKATGAFIGEVGFADYKRDITPPLGPLPEAGWVLSSVVHGRGFGSEAVAALHDWGDAHLAAEATCCIVAPDHAASIRLAENNGYRHIRDADYLGETVRVFERPRRRT